MSSRLFKSVGLVLALALFACAPSAIAAAPGPGDVLIAAQDHDAAGDGVIFSVNGAGAKNIVSTNDISRAAGGSRGFSNPFGVAVEAGGGLIVVDQGPELFATDGRVVRVDPSTGRQTVLTQNGNLVDSMGIAVVHTAIGTLKAGDLLIADESTPDPSGFYNDGAIIKVDPATGAQTIFSNNSISANATGDTAFADPIGVTQAADGTILVAEAVQASAAAVIEVNPATGAQKVISSNVISGALNPPGAQALVTPRSLVEEATGDILVANGDYDDPGHPSLIRVNRATGRQTVVSSGGNFKFLNAVALRQNGEILVLDGSSFGGAGALFNIAPNGTQTTLATDLSVPRGLAVYPGGGGGDGSADTTPPNTTKGKGPARRITSRTATFNFSSERGAAFFCQLDKKPPKPCTSPKKVRRLSNGRHTFTAIAVDALFNIDPTPAVWKFTVMAGG